MTHKRVLDIVVKALTLFKTHFQICETFISFVKVEKFTIRILHQRQQ